MKKLYIFVLALLICGNISAQTTQSEDYIRFIENQKTPFLKGNAETFLLDGTSWERLFWEKEYVLTPIMKDINTYKKRICQLDEPVNGIFKSKFHFIKVEVNNISKSLLSDMNIIVPNYIPYYVNVYLPEIDIDKLSEENINFTYLTDYGKIPAKISTENNKEINAVLFTEGFETSTVPGSVYSTNITGAANCGWQDENCLSHSGNWSVWCARTCDACGSYVNDMDSYFQTINFINTTGYQDLWFKFWLNYDMYDIGSNDILYRFYDLGSGWQLSATSYNSSSPNDGAGWNYVQVFYSGVYSDFAFAFEFTSNSAGTSNGVYIDDIELSGTPTVGIDDIKLDDNVISIYPNPTNGVFIIEGENMNTVEITTISGQKIKTMEVSENKVSIDLSTQSKGIYFAKIITDKGTVIKKLVIE